MRITDDTDLREALVRLASPADIRRIAAGVRSADEVRRLYALTADEEESVAYRAAWTLCHLAPAWHAVLHERYDDLASAAITAPHAGLRRLLLALLWRQPQPEPPRVDLLDFCLDAMADPAQPHGVRMYCMKLAYAMCRTQHDLLHEFRALLELIEPDTLPPSLHAVRRNVLAALERNRPLPRR